MHHIFVETKTGYSEPMVSGSKNLPAGEFLCGMDKVDKSIQP
jgi:hypothetical protein